MEVQIQAMPRKKQPPKRKWGDWIFKDNLTLVHVGYLSYEIDLENMSRENMLDWINHLSEKNHISPRDLGYFVYACHDIFESDSRYTKNPRDLFKINIEYLKNEGENNEF